MAIRFVEFSNGADCGRITNDVLKKFTEIFIKYISADILDSFRKVYGPSANINEKIEQACFDDGDNIVCSIHRVKIRNNIAWFLWDYSKFSYGMIYSSRSGNQHHGCIQIVVSQCLLEFLNNDEGLRRELNALYPDREIKIKFEPEYKSLDLVVADIEVKNRQRFLALSKPKSIFSKLKERTVKVFSQQSC